LQLYGTCRQRADGFTKAVSAQVGLNARVLRVIEYVQHIRSELELRVFGYFEILSE
jgi:hypothetical protein